MRVSHWMLRGSAAALVVLTAACNSLLGVSDVTGEAVDARVATPDARPDAIGGPPSRQCDVAPDFTLIAATPATSVLNKHTNDGGASLLFLLNNDTKPDALALNLYDNMGGHGVVNAVGSYTFGAPDASLATCALCVDLVTDFDSGTKMFSQTYFAAAQGTLKITTFDATGITGSLKGLKLREVDLSGTTTTDIPGGCTVTIGDAEFTAEWSTSLAATAPRQAAARMNPADAVLDLVREKQRHDR
ncbi:MAG: hypothetical protein ABIY55_03905 [Kofleriaceae bacterium]